MTVVEIAGSRCRGGLSPTVSLVCRDGLWSVSGGWLAWCSAALGSDGGSQVWPRVMAACRWRRIAAAMTVWAWVGRRLLCSRVVRCR